MRLVPHFSEDEGFHMIAHINIHITMTCEIELGYI